MSKYVKMIPLAQVEKITIELGKGRGIQQVKKDTGCDYILNGGLYDMSTGKPVCHLKTGGQVLAREEWGSWGYTWNTGQDITMEPVPDGTDKANYITCVPLLTPWDGIDAKLDYPAALGGRRGRTALAVARDKLVLYVSRDGTEDAATPERLRQELYDLGARTALMLDSGGSSQCDFGGRESITTGRRVQNYICVWCKKGKEEPEMGNTEKKYTVCLDPGHGPSSPNKSPDGSCYEYEFAWDMGQRIKPILEERGIAVVITRTAESHPTLTERANVSNKAGASLLVSIHSNASGSGGWTSPRGLMIYTSAAGDTAGRNKAAKAILERMRQAGVLVRTNGLLHESWTVLIKATAPAVLIEYGFHTNKEDVELMKTSEYRDTLARATADGICDYLGVAIPATPATPSTPDTPTETPIQAEKDPADTWAASAWEKVIKAGIMDGTRPKDTLTRQELSVVLDRLELLK